MGKGKKVSYLDLALYAFGGLGLEILVLLVEGMIYGDTNMWQWPLSSHLIHWAITCILWGSMSYILYKTAKKNGFDLWEAKEHPKLLTFGGIVVIMLICLFISYTSWGGQIKLIAEYASKVERYGDMAWLGYGAQYIYYFFETVLVVMVIAFGQRYGEEKWGNEKTKYIPWGGIICGLSWGLVHALTKGSLLVGLEALFGSILYGIAYLLLKKNVRYAYPLITLMFIL